MDDHHTVVIVRRRLLTVRGDTHWERSDAISFATKLLPTGTLIDAYEIRTAAGVLATGNATFLLLRGSTANPLLDEYHHVVLIGPP
jgi:hypothetical protein